MVDTVRLGVDEAARVILHAAATRGIERIERAQLDDIMYRARLCAVALDIAGQDVWDQMLALMRMPAISGAKEVPLMEFSSALSWTVLARESPAFFECAREGFV